MPRKRQTQKPVTAGLEAGASYGQVGENLTAQDPAQGGVPLPQSRNSPSPGAAPAPSGAGLAPPGAGLAPPPGGVGELPLAEAQGFNPGLTPLTAPGRGGPPPIASLPRTNSSRSAALLSSWAKATGDPALQKAAIRLASKVRTGG